MTEEIVVATSEASGTAAELETKIDEELLWAKEKRQEGEWRFGRLARLFAEYDDRECWRGRFSSWNKFVLSKAQQFEVSRSIIYNLTWVGRRLARHMTEGEMRQIGKSKLYLLASQTPDDGRPPDPELVEQAKTLPCEEFEARIQRPLLAGETREGQEICKITFWITKDEKKLLGELMGLARRIEGVESKHRIFVFMIDISRSHWLEEEQRVSESNMVKEEGF
jgi:hypothetical protein